MTAGEPSPGWDAERGRLRLTRRQLAGLAATVEGAPADDDLTAALGRAGLANDRGRLVGGAALAAVAAASFAVRLRLWRVPCGEPGRRLELVAGPDGLVAFVPDDPAEPDQVGDPDEVGEVIAQPPERVAVTLWRMLGLGPRPDPPRPTVEVEAATLRQAFDQGDAALGRQLGVDPSELVLLRVDAARRDGDAEIATLAVIDAGSHGVWEGRGDAAAMTLVPRSSEGVFAGLARLQREARAEAPS